MVQSPNIGLTLTSVADNRTFRDWRSGLDGTDASSNMMLIDAAFGDVAQWQDERESTGITWGMLKNGLGYVEP